MSTKQRNPSLILAFLIIAMAVMIRPGLAQVDVDVDDTQISPTLETSFKKHHGHHGHNHGHSSPPPEPADSPDNSPDDKNIKHIPKKLKEFVEECTKHISNDCADEIVAALYNPDKKKEVNIDAKCCHQLVRIGLKCHDAIVKVFIGLPGVHKDAKVIKRNSHRVFHSCEIIDKRNQHLSPPPRS
ncbi:OLC1v1035315C1 [Oldenlandia corymbosa var. corymbosa]|uniref:OLC1v1035315C1 n=1 Tax=Oldenlandia corymbosa var. corymbosa TaxID=529605 RepID=A0AAV1CSR8_OLDCO|nr:OLC1v1035315C1 [Oldenlandia corymbosa var. corymbosa]